MNGETNNGWAEANQRYLTARLRRVRAALERHTAGMHEAAASTASATTSEAVEPSRPPANSAAPEPLDEAVTSFAGSSALGHLAGMFSLSPFEQDLLLLCAGIEFDGTFPALCASAHGDARRNYATFSLALTALPDPHWNALTAAAPLRRWRLIEVVNSGEGLLQSQLRIDERVLHYLAGISYMDQRLEGLVRPFGARRDLPRSQQKTADHIADFWSRRKVSSEWPIVVLCGRDQSGKANVAARACSLLGLRLHVLRAEDAPQSVAERETFARLWEREGLLLGSALLVETGDQEMPAAALALIEALSSVLLVSVPESLNLRNRSAYRVEVHKPSAIEQRSLWIDFLGPAANQLNGELELLVSQFSLGSDAILDASELARQSDQVEGEKNGSVTAVWDACRMLARPRLDDLAQRIVPAATWSDLVLPDSQSRSLREVSAHVRQRAKVHGDWGFAAKGERGLGISALFAGSSGTGKTMAAEVLANELRLDLYRIDLSQVVSKYIGETEKNLRRVFDAADDGGAVLLFDEADALFGKRSEVKDSHDRYANIEVSYLLQRMEAYRGLAILTTNLKAAVDTAFLRRLRFVIEFPFPDAPHRAEIWRRIFPAETPTQDLDVSRLARLSIPGGNIRNIALHAAFLAADAGGAVTMAHLARAARSEYAKLEKPLTEAEIGGW
jgi:ATPase family associated with various cellular activities (AAA)